MLRSIMSFIISIWINISTIFIPTSATLPAEEIPTPTPNLITESIDYQLHQPKAILKDVGEAYLPNFGVTPQDFQDIKSAGIDTIEGNFDICASQQDTQYFLDQSQSVGLKVILPAGSGEAEWGYECDQEQFPSTQTPQWQSQRVTTWINKWKTHPALYAWDTSNEAGSNFPNADQGDKFYLTAAQLQQAYQDVKSSDPNHPVLIRMNGWFFYDNDDNFFIIGNPFSTKTADIIMINAYSNVQDYYPDFVPTVLSRSKSAIYQIQPNTKLIIALAVWQEPPIWTLPTTQHLNDEIQTVHDHPDLLGIAYFKYGANGSEWYLPQDAPLLWQEIQNANN